MKILLVEDDTALRGALEELLCREGYDVLKAANVKSACDSVEPGIDLIMLDVALQVEPLAQLSFSGAALHLNFLFLLLELFCGTYLFHLSTAIFCGIL